MSRSLGSVLKLFFTVVAILICIPGLASQKVVTIGFAQGIEFNIEQNTLNPTIKYLQEKLPQYEFRLEQISPVDTLEEIKKSNLNFLFAPSNFYIEISQSLPLTHIVTRRKNGMDNPTKAVGSVFVVKNDRVDLRNLSDLRGKSCAASLPNSLGGWLAAAGEIKKNGWNPEDFFTTVNFLQFQTPDVLNAVLSGAADVGVLSTCTLENSIAQGLIEKNSLRVINAQEHGGKTAACVSSTSELYPDLTFVAVKGTPEELIRNVAVSLLTMPSFDGYHWSFEDDYYTVRNLLQTLQIGPYAYLKDNSLSGLYQRFKNEIFFVIGLILFLLANELRLNWLVNKKTDQLKQALKEKIATDKIVREERKKFAILERNGLIAQMSSIIAHEAKQPMGTILNYLEILRMRLSQQRIDDPTTLIAIENVDQQIVRLNSLVESVRNFAKRKQNPLIKSDLVEVCKKAIRAFERNEPEFEKIKISFSSDREKAYINSDPFSLELLILNLLRNGAQAALSVPNDKTPVLKLLISTIERGRLQITVENSGPIMTDKKMQRLISLGESVKAEGLGLGLSIIRSIADQHSADLRFVKREGGGVVAILIIDEYGEQS